MIDCRSFMFGEWMCQGSAMLGFSLLLGPVLDCSRSTGVWSVSTLLSFRPHL